MLGKSEMFQHPGVAQVGVDQQHRVIDLPGDADGEVDGCERLALATPRAGHSQHIPFVFLESLQHLRAQDIVGLGEVAGFQAGNDAIFPQHGIIQTDGLGLGIR